MPAHLPALPQGAGVTCIRLFGSDAKGDNQGEVMVRNDSFAQLAPSNCFCVRLSWLIVGTLRCVADQVDHAVVRHGKYANK